MEDGCSILGHGEVVERVKIIGHERWWLGGFGLQVWNYLKSRCHWSKM